MFNIQDWKLLYDTMTTIQSVVTFLESKDDAILDIRQDVDALNLRDEIISGLQADNPTLPSMLLWDDRGQKLFDRLTQCPFYYPFHSEAEILNERGCELGDSIPDQGVLLELGCGYVSTCRKSRDGESGTKQWRLGKSGKLNPFSRAFGGYRNEFITLPST